MTQSQLLELLQQLLTKSEERGIRWQKTASDTAFRIGLGGGLVRVELQGYERPEPMMVVINGDGVEVASLRVTSNSSMDVDQGLRDLYAAARSSALGLKELVEGMLDALQKGQITVLPPDEAPDEMW